MQCWRSQSCAWAFSKPSHRHALLLPIGRRSSGHIHTGAQALGVGGGNVTRKLRRLVVCSEAQRGPRLLWSRSRHVCRRLLAFCVRLTPAERTSKRHLQHAAWGPDPVAGSATHPASQAKCSRSTLQLLSDARCSAAHCRPAFSHSDVHGSPGEPSATVTNAGIFGVGGAAVVGFPAAVRHNGWNLKAMHAHDSMQRGTSHQQVGTCCREAVMEGREVCVLMHSRLAGRPAFVAAVLKSGGPVARLRPAQQDSM